MPGYCFKMAGGSRPLDSPTVITKKKVYRRRRLRRQNFHSDVIRDRQVGVAFSLGPFTLRQSPDEAVFTDDGQLIAGAAGFRRARLIIRSQIEADEGNVDASPR